MSIHGQGFSGEVGCLTPIYDEDNLPQYDKVLWNKAPLFDYTTKKNHLQYTDKKGNVYELDNHFKTDGGSIPSMVQPTPFLHLNPFDFLRSYLYHDCGFIFGGLYIKYLNEINFKFRLLTRVQVNDLLGDMMPFDGATEADVETITFAVRIGSIVIWDKKIKPLKQKEMRKLNRINVYDRKGLLIEENK